MGYDGYMRKGTRDRVMKEEEVVVEVEEDERKRESVCVFGGEMKRGREGYI